MQEKIKVIKTATPQELLANDSVKSLVEACKLLSIGRPESGLEGYMIAVAKAAIKKFEVKT